MIRKRTALKNRLALVAIFTFVITLFYPARADVVKPALIEISAYSTEVVEVEIRTSVEALLTGINGRFRNTTEAPNADEYDRLREMDGPTLTAEFEGFHERLISQTELLADGKRVELRIDRVEIPEAGYTQVPRNSVIYLKGALSREAKSLTWYYPEAFGDHATRVRQIGTEMDEFHWSAHQWVKSDQPTEPFSLTQVFSQPSLTDILTTYTYSGFEHIIPLGLDHILFVLGIFLLSRRLPTILWQVTMFTLAHSITLALGVYGWVNLPAQVVEPLIALSIAYIGIENIWRQKLSRLRLPLIFAFGLLHGLGFASVLTDFGMPTSDFAWALVAFNVGVEIGQVAIVLASYLLVARWFKSERAYRLWVVIPGSALIGLAGLYWFFERIEWI